MHERLTDLEIRLTHQEAALDELTRSQLASEARLNQLQDQLDVLRRQLHELLDGLRQAGQ